MMLIYSCLDFFSLETYGLKDINCWGLERIQGNHLNLKA